MIRLLLHSHDTKIQGLLSVTLGEDFRVVAESDREQVKKVVTAGQADVLILDFDSAHSSLEDLLGYLREPALSRVPVVVMTDDERRSTAMELVQHGVYDYFRKPPHLLELRIVVRRAHEHAKLKMELEKTRQRLQNISRCDRLIGSSEPMRAVYDLVRRVANINTYVLIAGESGTGKELIARAIHNLGERAQAPFVAVPCGAIPETLVESELFGHEKGAFTGAAGPRAGYMEQAGDGTLLLDEIGELSPLTQVKLLRVLQEKEFQRLGGRKPMPLKARVLFATHRNLGEMVEAGTFRQDLYFRINVMKITAPSLRDRPDDIPELAHYFLQTYAESHRKTVREIEPAAMDLLLQHSWIGNVRELENVIQQSVILAEGSRILVQDLPRIVAKPAVKEDGAGLASSFEDRLRNYKVKLALETVEECHGNKSEAARRLSISRVYLHSLLRQGKVEAA